MGEIIMVIYKVECYNKKQHRVGYDDSTCGYITKFYDYKINVKVEKNWKKYP